MRLIRRGTPAGPSALNGCMPASTVGHFGMAGTYLWVAGGQACVVLTDREFGDWAKPLWQETNTALWEALA